MCVVDFIYPPKQNRSSKPAVNEKEIEEEEEEKKEAKESEDENETEADTDDDGNAVQDTQVSNFVLFVSITVIHY